MAEGAAGTEGGEEPRLGLVGDLVDELRWTFSGRKGWLIGMGFNLVMGLIVVGVQRYDPHRVGAFNVTRIGVAVVLYVLADPINTNQLGSDMDRVAVSLEHRDTVTRILAIKNLSLAVLLIPVAVLVSVVVRGVLVGRWGLLGHSIVSDVSAVFLWLAVGSVISVLLPYRPISLRRRLKARGTWRRWALCMAVPYGACLLLFPLLHLPFFVIYHQRLLGPKAANFTAYTLVYLAIGLAYWLLGLSLASLYARLHSPRLTADLHRDS